MNWLLSTEADFDIRKVSYDDLGGRNDILVALLENGADADAVYPLHLALSSGNYEAAKILVEKGANVLKMRDGKTALKAAIELLGSRIDPLLMAVVQSMLGRVPSGSDVKAELSLLQETAVKAEERLASFKALLTSPLDNGFKPFTANNWLRGFYHDANPIVGPPAICINASP